MNTWTALCGPSSRLPPEPFPASRFHPFSSGFSLTVRVSPEYSVLLAAYLDIRRCPKSEWDLLRGSAGYHCLEYSQTLWHGLSSLYSNSILQLLCPLLPSFPLQSSHIIPAIPKYNIVLYTAMSYLFPLASQPPHLVIKSKQNFYKIPSVFEC